MPIIRAISFDLDDTLWPIWPIIERAETAMHDYLERHCPKTAAAYPMPRMRELREEVARAHPHLAHDFTRQRMICLAHALEDAGEDVAHAEPAFQALYLERNRVDFFDDALPALKALATNYTLAALTNGNADLQRIGIADQFAVIVTARDFGAAKPERAIFDHTAERLGLRADEVLHVGDDPWLDVEGAARAGMRTCWVNRRDEAWPAELPAPDLAVTRLDSLVEALASGHFTSFTPAPAAKAAKLG